MIGMGIRELAGRLVIQDLLVFRCIYIAVTVLLILVAYLDRRMLFRRLTERRTQIIWIVLISVFLAVFAALRPLDSPDTEAYYDTYVELESPAAYVKYLLRLGNRIYGMEIGFILLFSILKCVFHSFRFFLFCIALVNALLFLFSAVGIANLKQEKIHFAQMLAMFFSFFALHYCCIAIRAGTSLGLGLLGVWLLLKKKHLWAFLALYGAMLFHIMAFLLLAFFALTLIRRDKVDFPVKILIVCSVVCLAVMTVNLGPTIMRPTVKLIRQILDKTGVMGLRGYLIVEPGDTTGKRIWLTALSSIAILFSIYQKAEVDRNMIIMILMGLFITAFLYPIRAINRASDYCFLFLLPILASCRFEKMSFFGKAFMGYAIFPAFFILQLTL
jgi:hypothetical protein